MDDRRLALGDGTLATDGAKATGGNTATGGAPSGGTSGTGGEPPSGAVRVFYLRPSDVAFEQRYPDGIGNVLLETQAFFKQQLGKTFKLNSPIVEFVVGEHVQSWYENTANGGDKYWWSATNAQQEIQRRFKLPDSSWMGVSEISAEGDGAGGGASGGWVLLCGHDADGGAGYPANKARWVGGMVHEMGHAFGLPDSTSTDGTCMSGSFYSWPNWTFIRLLLGSVTETQVRTRMSFTCAGESFGLYSSMSATADVGNDTPCGCIDLRDASNGGLLVGAQAGD